MQKKSHQTNLRNNPEIFSQQPYQQIVIQVQKFPDLLKLPQTMTSSILIDYDTESVTQKLENYSDLLSAEKTAYIKNITAILESLDEGCKEVKEEELLQRLFTNIMNDREQFRRALLFQLPNLITYISKQPSSIPKLKQYLIPLVIKFLSQTSPQLKQQAGTYLYQIATHLDSESIGESILTCILQLAHDNQNQQNRLVAVQLFSKMAELLGRELCQQFVEFEFEALGEDLSEKVRKQAIKNLPKLARIVSQEYFREKTFQFYLEKVQQINPVYRKAAIEIVDQMSELCDAETKKEGTLDVIMLQYLKDKNKFVKAAAYKRLGAYIHTLKDLAINPLLIESYIKMATSELDPISTNNDILYSCAYNFAAVLNAVGSSKWSQLTGTYSKLLKSSDKRIRKTLASSLHEIAKILGEKRTKQHLFAVLDRFLKDPRDQVKIQSIRTISNVLQILSPQKREQLVDIFMTLQNDHKKWRIRLSIATQLSTLSQIYSPQTVFSYIVPITFKLCSDDVSFVRQQAAKRVPDVIKSFNSQLGRMYIPAVMENVRGFCESRKYTQRQIFVLICEGLVELEGGVIDIVGIMKMVERLVEDRVVDVRMVVAGFVERMMSKGKGEMVEGMVEKLRKDQVEDVREMFQLQEK